MSGWWAWLLLRLGGLARAREANVAVIFALTIVPMTVAAGAGVDIARGMVVRTRLSEALDAAALAVGASPNLSQQAMTTLAQQYFNANYTVDTGFGTPSPVTVVKSGQTITVASSVPMPTTWVKVVGITNYTVSGSSQVVWGGTKLWVALALDNTGSMAETDSTGTSKLTALKTATHALLTTLKNAATKDGDVEVAIIPFSKTVNVGTGYVSASWIDWTDWESAPPNGVPATSVGPGSACPYSTFDEGYKCQSTPANGSSSANNIPSSGAYSGYICPGIDSGSDNSGRKNRYYNGCYNSVPTVTVSNGSSTTTTVCTNSSSCTTASYCSGYPSSSSSTSGSSVTVTTTTCECHTTSGTKKTCTRTAKPVTTTTGAPYTHTWIKNDHSTWTGCVMDRNQDYDTKNTTPDGTAAKKYPAENSANCVPSTLGTLGYNWTGLNDQVDDMSAGGSTNQTIGLAWAWQAFTQGVPLSAPVLPADTKMVIIHLSDGLNTQNRWNGDGLNQSTQVNDRMSAACTNVKAANVIVYTVFVDLNGTSGNSTVMQNCATDSSKYYDLTTSGAIITTFDQIAQEITNLRVAK